MILICISLVTNVKKKKIQGALLDMDILLGKKQIIPEQETWNHK